MFILYYYLIDAHIIKDYYDNKIYIVTLFLLPYTNCPTRKNNTYVKVLTHHISIINLYQKRHHHKDETPVHFLVATSYNHHT